MLEQPVCPAGALRLDSAGLGLAELNFIDGLTDAGSGSDPCAKKKTLKKNDYFS